MNRKSDLFYVVLHLPADIIAISLAYITSYWLRGNGLEIYHLPYSDYLALVRGALPLWLLVFALQGLYTKRYLFGTLQNMFRIAVAVLASWATFVVYLTFLKTEQTFVFPRLLLVYILVLAFVYVFAGRLILRFIQFMARLVGIGRHSLLIVGDTHLAHDLEKNVTSQHGLEWQSVKQSSATEPSAVATIIAHGHFDEVIIADPSLSDDRTFETIMAVQNSGATCHILPKMFDVQSSNVVFHTLGGLPVLTLRQTPLEGWGRIVKRIIDIILAILGLILASPILLVLAIIIKITDPGPAIYSHSRIGRGGKKFKVYKLRSMLVKYSTGGRYSQKSQEDIFRDMGREDLIEEWKRDHKVKHDPRITPIGKFIRKSRLDELPQLFNVLRGDLSLVGPRPITQVELERYGRWASYLLSIKPGLTGLWQVSGNTDVSYDERVKLDAHYVQNWSLLQDFIIMTKTFFLVIRGGDGY